MGEIHGVVYIIIGAFFAISSKIIDVSREESKLSFFVIVGIIMILVGIFKLVMKEYKGRAKHAPAAKRRCHRCGTVLHVFQEFCHRCGTKLFR
ncbi:hypothetical protein KY361_01760 [Candidatus Woesearchaeota archaeon]|nr:hypothetical protein [Candidatus Woesearchaeota archaeon]